MSEEEERTCRICYNHKTPLTYPIEYEACPGCGIEKMTRLTLGQD